MEKKKTTEAQKKATLKYLEGFEEVRARVPKGEKEPIKAHAQARGESLNGFIVRAISETIERDNATPTASSELKES